MRSAPRPRRHTLRRLSFAALCGAALTAAVFADTPRINSIAYAQSAAASVPADLKPLLTPKPSEMRMVVQRYALDRTTLSGNYANGTARGGGGGGRGRGGAAAATPPPPPVALSPARIARLKRFDMNWQAAANAINAAPLSADARKDLDGLKASIANNLKALETETQTIAQVTAAVPFTADLVKLIEARIRVEAMNGEHAARTSNDIKKRIAVLMVDAPRVNKATAELAAIATDQLRQAHTEWFNFYNAYDPLFQWWVRMPYAQLDKSLEEYAAFLRNKVAAENLAVPTPTTAQTIAPSPVSKYNDVPNLQEIIALPHDEMDAVVTRFTSAGAGGGRGGGRGAQGDAAPAAVRDTAFYQAWLNSLKSLDFDSLSRNAQVDYLFIRQSAETQIARANLKLDPNPPRKPDNTGIPGPARGRDGLIQDLSEAMIPYTPEQLIALAEKEFEWCDKEMLKATKEMGLGTDWKKAIEKTKDTAVPPGGQPRMIMDLLDESIAFLREKDSITVPAVAAESLHMIMMTPERQLVNPFFTGGGQISVSYPTDTMDFEQRIQSMRGNNPGFSHATAFHEMIPGHNLVGFMSARFNDYRANLSGGGPFFGEGWPLYWELALYDQGFDKTPEQKVGALFWRMHRCARIIFSLKFHMGQWSPKECIDFLVDRVGHERDNATAEVRRSFDPAAGYGPLYQAAYLLGGLQLRGLHKEVVESKQMTDKAFHDEIMRQGGMPIALLRLAVGKTKLTRDMTVSWPFYGDLK